jgi:hypothetical protein
VFKIKLFENPSQVNGVMAVSLPSNNVRILLIGIFQSNIPTHR